MAKKNNRGLVVIERGGSGSGVLWLLLGGAIGAGLGLLLAPHSGKKSRELLGERLKRLKASAEETLEELSEEEDEEELLEGEDEASPAEGEAQGEEEDEQAEPEPRRSTPTARSELEQRLARARARRHRALVEEDEEPVA
jgi:gas vesicle protein